MKQLCNRKDKVKVDNKHTLILALAAQKAG